MDAAAALDELARKNGPFYRRLAHKYLRDSFLVEDAVQEGFTKFLHCGREFDGLVDAEKFLCRLLINHFLDRLRRRSRTPARMIMAVANPDGLGQAGADSGPEEWIQDRERREIRTTVARELSDRLTGLPSYQREIIHLLFFREPPLTYRQISEMKKIPLTTVYSRARSALDSLRSESWDLLSQLEDL